MTWHAVLLNSYVKLRDSTMPYAHHKILIVEDEPGLLFSLAAFLEDDGYSVQRTSSGEEALDGLREESFNIVIIDVRLPSIDGNEVILEAKRSGSQATFFIHTGSTDYQIPMSLKQYGFSQEDIFLKPISDLNIFSQAIENRMKNE